MPLVRRTRATLRSAEFGFFGVVVYTRVQTPRRWGEPFNAGVLVFSTLSSRPLRTSWLIVGMGGLDLLPALGRALECLALPVVPGAGPAGAPSGSGRQPPSGPRGRACCRPVDRPMSSVRTRLPLATRRRHPPVGTGRQDPGDRKATQAHREREQAQGTLGTADHDTRGFGTGQSRGPHIRGQLSATARRGGRPPPPRGGAAPPPPRPRGGVFPGAFPGGPPRVPGGPRQNPRGGPPGGPPGG